MVHFETVHNHSSPVVIAAGEVLAALENILWSWGRGSKANRLTIPAAQPHGFDIELFSDARGIRACFGGLEQDFDSIEQAAVWVGRALSDAYRLKIEYLGDRPWRWTLEEIEPSGIAGRELVCGYPALFASLRKKRIVYCQNGNVWPRAIAGALLLAAVGLGTPAGPARAELRDPMGPAAIDQTIAKDKATALVIEGVAQARNGQVEDAIRLFSLAIRAYPRLAAAYANRGVALSRTEHNREAAADFSHAIALDPEDYRILSYRGLAHAKMGAHAPALEDFARAIALAPGFPMPYGGQALVFVAQGRFEEAIDSCNRAISLGLRDADIYKTRAVAHLGLGELEEARADQRLAELGSNAR